MRALTPIKVIVGVVVLVIAGFAAAYFLFFTSDSPAPLTLSETPGTTSGPSAATGVQTPTSASATVVGVWKVTGGSEAGYRVREKLVALPAQSDAVGRTPAVTGQVKIEQAGAAITASEARFEADLTKLSSDKSQRDNRIRTQGLESNRFPTATFVAAEPIKLPDQPADGQMVKVSAVGDLTVHGVTKRVTIPMDARMSSGQIELVGSLQFPMSDFAIDPPNVAGVVTVEPDATLEFRLLLQRS